MAIGSSDPFFPSIGSHANETAARADNDDQLPLATSDIDGEFHPVEEIESLCMECHENVSPSPVDIIRVRY
jgi:hypothetical protein